MHIVSFLHELDQTKLSGSTKLYIYKVLKSVFNQAVKWKVIKVNPVEGADRPKLNKKKPKFYDEHDAQKVIAALLQEPPKWKFFFLAAMLGGFRRGELVALEWPEVNFEENTIRVCKSISITQDGKAFEKAPKTEGSERLVDMPEWFMEEFRKYNLVWRTEQKWMGDKWCGGDRQYVFHGGDGQPLYLILRP